MEDECRALGGCFLDYLSGQYRINLLEPRCWDDGSGPEDPDAPDAFRGTLLSQHISCLLYTSVFKDHALMGVGLMLSAGEVPRIAGSFGLDTTTKANITSAVYTCLLYTSRCV